MSKIGDWLRASINEHVRPEIQALAKRGGVTPKEVAELRCNSWEWRHLVPAMDDEAFAACAEHALANCSRSEQPWSYDGAVLELYAPELLKRFRRLQLGVRAYAETLEAVREVLGQKETHYFVMPGDVAELVEAAMDDDGRARGVINRLRTESGSRLTDVPITEYFFAGVAREAAYQREKFGTESDAGKTPADWFWLVWYLAGKALAAHISGNREKALHHAVSTAAACANWHAAISGKDTRMRPGIEPPPETERIRADDLPVDRGGYERTPDGRINNCSLANGEAEVDCQMCNGECPDRGGRG